MICERCARDADPPKCWWCDSPIDSVVDDYHALKAAKFMIDKDSRLIINLTMYEPPYSLEIEPGFNTSFAYNFKKLPPCHGILGKLRADHAFILGRWTTQGIDGWYMTLINIKVLAKTFLLYDHGPMAELDWTWLI